MSGLCKETTAAEAIRLTQPKMDDDLGILPPRMRKNLLATMSRNHEAFEALAKL